MLRPDERRIVQDQINRSQHYAQIEAHNERLKKENEELRDKREADPKDIKSYEKKLRTAAKLMEKTTAALDKAKERIERLTYQITAITEARDFLIRNRASATVQCDQMSKQISELRALLNEREHTIGELRRSLDDYQNIQLREAGEILPGDLEEQQAEDGGKLVRLKGTGGKWVKWRPSLKRVWTLRDAK